jgi:cell division protein FtsL
MKKKNSFIPMLLMTSLVLIFSIFIYLFSVNEIKAMNKDKNILVEKLTQVSNKLETRIVEVQRLSSENRIVKIAKDSLGLIRSTKPYKTIYIDNDQIKQVNRIVNSKYE